MKKENYIMLGILIVCIGIFLFLIIKPATMELTEEQQRQEYIRQLERAFVPEPWETNGVYTWLENNKVIINVTEGTNQPIVNLTTKDYEGEIDFVIGFNTGAVKPRGAYYYRQNGYETINNTYTCTEQYNYTTNPLHFWCYSLDEDNQSSTHFRGYVDGGDIPSQTVWWETLNQWQPLAASTFERIDLNFEGNNRWYVKRNFSLQNNRSYVVKFDFQQLHLSGANKYWIGFKPANLTFLEAVEDNKLIVLDPWTSNLEDGLVSYYKHDSGTTNATHSLDSRSLNIGVLVASPILDVPGKINEAINFSSDYVNISDSASLKLANNQTISLWIKYPSNVGTDTIIDARSTIAPNHGFTFTIISDKPNFRMDTTSGSAGTSATTETSNNTWFYIVGLYNGTHQVVYVNGVQEGIGARTGTIGKVTPTRIGTGNLGASDWFDGDIDEVSIYNRTLTQAEITALYNSGVGLTIPTSPVINITFPLPTTYQASQDAMNYTIDTGSYCWNSVDNGTTNSSAVVAGINFTNLISGADNNTWTLWCNNTFDEVTMDNVTFVVNTSIGTILITPTDNAEFNITNVLFEYNSTTVGTNLTNVTHFIWFNNGTNFLTNTTSFPGTPQTTQELSTVQTGLLQNVYNWSARTCGTDLECVMAINRTFETHTTNPDIVITFPTGNLGATLNNTVTFLNWSVSEVGEANLTDHITNCSYIYNGVTEYLDNVSHCTETNQTSFTYSSGINTINFTVVDEFNFTTTNTSSWVVPISEINQSWSNTTIEGTTETFTINYIIDPSLTVSSASLFYNGVSSSGTTTNVAGQLYNSTVSIIIPSVSADTNVSFNWVFTMSDSNTYNGTTKNQTVQNLSVDDCSSFTTLFINMSLIDEEFQGQLNGTTQNTTIEIDLTIEDLTNSIEVASFSQSFNETNPATVCLNLNLSTANQYDYDATIRYDADGYANEFYHVQRGNLSDALLPVNISLFDLKDADTTEFQITFKDTNFVIVEDAIITISREYVGEGVFKTVEVPKTDSNGQTVAHLVEKDVKYNMIVIKNGEILGTFNNLVAFCEDAVTGSCFISLNALGSNTPIFEYNETMGIAFVPLTYNSTSRILTFSYTTVDGTSKLVNLTAVKMDQIGNVSACDESVTSASSTLTCTVPGSVGNATIFINIYVDNELKLVDYLSTGKNLDSGDFGYLLLIFMILSFALMLSSTKTGIIIGVMLGFITASVFAWIEGGIIGFGSATMWLIISGIILIWGLNTKSQA